MLFRNGYCCGGRRVTSDLCRAVTAKLKGSPFPVRVSLQPPQIVGFRVILSHFPQRPTATLLSQADVAGESVHRALLDEQEDCKLCSPSRACFLWAKEQDQTYEPLIPLSLCSVAECHTSSLMAQAVLNFKPAQVSRCGEARWKCRFKFLGLSFCSFLCCSKPFRINQPRTSISWLKSWSCYCFDLFSLRM